MPFRKSYFQSKFLDNSNWNSDWHETRFRLLRIEFLLKYLHFWFLMLARKNNKVVARPINNTCIFSLFPIFLSFFSEKNKLPKNKSANQTEREEKKGIKMKKTTFCPPKIHVKRVVRSLTVKKKKMKKKMKNEKFLVLYYQSVSVILFLAPREC